MPRARILIMLVAAVGLAVFGVSRFLVALDTPPAAAEVANVDGLAAAVTTAGWTRMDHDMSSGSATPGFQMPPAMMPGMPEGDDQRLALSVTVTNTSDDTRPLRAAKEFTLYAGKDGRQWTPAADTFGDLPRLAPRNAVTGVLFFDLPPAELAAAPAWVEWSHGDATTRLTIPLDGVNAGPGHSHNP